jgi:hypothetical protein
VERLILGKREKSREFMILFFILFDDDHNERKIHSQGY